jgi:hypothetical protein
MPGTLMRLLYPGSAEMKVLSIALLAAVGCATHVVTSNPRSVLVESWWLNGAKAQKMADAECAKSSRVAVMRLKADYDETNYVFECVDR